MRWTLDQLRTLVAVAERGTMSGAAATLGYTTGAVSQQMAALARAVGRPLFLRDGARLVLSDDGRVLVEQARLVLEAEARAAAVAPRTLAGVGGAARGLRVGRRGRAARGAGPAGRSTPAVALQAVEVDVEAMPDAVLRDEIDLALGLDYSDAPLPPRRGLDVARLHREPFLLVLPPGADGRRRLGRGGAGLRGRDRLDPAAADVDLRAGRPYGLRPGRHRPARAAPGHRHRGLDRARRGRARASRS